MSRPRPEPLAILCRMSASRLSEPPARSRIETEVLRLRALLEKGELTEALEGAQSLLQEVPENRDVWYLIAVSSAVSEAHSRGPRDARPIRAAASRVQSALPGTRPLLRRAARGGTRDRGFPASGQHQPGASGELEFAAYPLTTSPARKRESEKAAAHVATLSNLPPEIVTANSMFADGEVYAAEQIVRRYLLKHGDHVEGMRLLARIGMKLEVLDDAELLLERALMLAPDYQAMRYDYALTLLQRHKHVQAVAELEKLLAADPGQPRLQDHLRDGLRRRRQDRGSRRALSGDSRRDAAAADIHLSMAHALKTLGQTRRRGAELPRRLRGPPELRRRLLEPGQPQDLSILGPGARAHARTGGLSLDRERGSLSSVFRPRQGARGSRRVRGVVRLL